MSDHINAYFLKRGPPLPPVGTIARTILTNSAHLHHLTDNDVSIYTINAEGKLGPEMPQRANSDPVYRKLREAQCLEKERKGIVPYHVGNALHRMLWRTMKEKEYNSLNSASLEDIMHEKWAIPKSKRVRKPIVIEGVEY